MQPDAHAVANVEALLSSLGTSPHGLSRAEAAARLEQYGRNTLPKPKPRSVTSIFLHQFLSPLIYILLLAAGVSLMLQHAADVIFISAVLFINAVIGTVQ